jgi:hypothetical protein
MVSYITYCIGCNRRGASQVALLQGVGIGTVVSDPVNKRRLDRLCKVDRAAVEAARRTVRSMAGKALLKRRAEFVERGFQHVLDRGRARRTTLRGRDNVRKRYLVQR